jgi:hypothetical protein
MHIYFAGIIGIFGVCYNVEMKYKVTFSDRKNRGYEMIH